MKKLLLLPLLLTAVYTQGTFSGTTYFDYTYDLTKDADNDAGFALKRVYFTYQQELSEGLSYKFQTDVGQLEVVNINDDEQLDGTKKTQFVAYLKNAKIDKNFYFAFPPVWNSGDAWNLGKGKLTIGLQGMNMFNVTEKTWGFRFLEKSPMDKYAFSSSADMGIGCSGNLNNFNYNIMYTNGSGYKKSETDRHKKISAQLVYGEKKLVEKDGINIGTSFSIEPYDIEDDEENITTENKTVMAFFGGYAGNGLRVGAEFDMHTDAGTDVTQQIIAAYGSYKISDTLEILASIDLYDPWTESIDDEDTEDIDEAKDSETNVIAGINYYPAKGLTITPNIKFNLLEAPGGEGFQFSVNFQFKF